MIDVNNLSESNSSNEEDVIEDNRIYDDLDEDVDVIENEDGHIIDDDKEYDEEEDNSENDDEVKSLNGSQK